MMFDWDEYYKQINATMSEIVKISPDTMIWLQDAERRECQGRQTRA